MPRDSDWSVGADGAAAAVAAGPWLPWFEPIAKACRLPYAAATVADVGGIGCFSSDEWGVGGILEPADGKREVDCVSWKPGGITTFRWGD